MSDSNQELREALERRSDGFGKLSVDDAAAFIEELANTEQGRAEDLDKQIAEAEAEGNISKSIELKNRKLL